jgi:iron complex outermembrane recepter protein
MVNAFASMRFTWGDTRFLGWLRASNLGNRDARLASSVLRETVPLGGRALTAGLRVDF